MGSKCLAAQSSNYQIIPSKFISIDMSEQIDRNNSLMKSYDYQDDNIYKKNTYNWHNLPITALLDKKGCVFSFRNVQIKDNNFMVGVVTQKAVKTVQRTPWKTDQAFCLQSYNQDGQSSIIHKNIVKKVICGVKKNQVVSVKIEQEFIWFQIEDKCIVKQPLPQSFKNENLYPYLVLFSEGDKIKLQYTQKTDEQFFTKPTKYQ